MASLKELKKWAKKLNSYDLAEEVDLKQDAEDLQEDFITTIEELADEDKTDGIDDKLLDFYEALIDEEDGAEEPEEEEEEEEEEEKPKPKRKPRKAKAKPEPEEEEEEEEEDEPEEEEDEGDEYDDMDRSALVKVAKGAGIKCMKSMSEDDYRDAIRATLKPATKKAGKATTKKAGKRPGNFTPSGKVAITEAAAMAIKAKKGKSTTVKDLAKATNDIRVEGGGKDSVTTCGYYIKFALKVLSELGHATSDGKKVKFS